MQGFYELFTSYNHFISKSGDYAGWDVYAAHSSYTIIMHKLLNWKKKTKLNIMYHFEANVVFFLLCV